MIGENVLTRRQQDQASTALMNVIFGENKVLFVVQTIDTVRELARFLHNAYHKNIDLEFRQQGWATWIRLKGGKGVLIIEAHCVRDQYQGREFSGVFVDEWAALDRETLDLLASRVR